MPKLQTNAHWNLVVSSETDNALRQFLDSQDNEHQDNLSHFVEEAVRTHILDLAALAAKKENASHSQTDIENAIDEALSWARQ